MDQQIRFCTASDGVRIAYAVIGSGVPLVYVCGWPEHLELEWEKPFARAFLEALADGCTLIRYDMRGSGLSDPDVDDFSLASLIKDLEAVVDDLGLSSFPLLGLGMVAGPVAISYAVSHPGRVSHLALNSAYVCGPDLMAADRREALVDYVSKFGFPHFDFHDHPALQMVEQRHIREISAGSPPVMQAAVLRTHFGADLRDMVSRVNVPALILHGRGDRIVPFAQGRELAAALPHARFVPYDGANGPPWTDSHIIIPQIHRFIGVEPAPVQPPTDSGPGLVTILFTDIEGSTALTQRLGDEQARQLLRTHEQIVRGEVKTAGGTEVKTMGDGFMLSFPSASRALECAIALQRAFAALNAGVGAPLGGRGGAGGAAPRGGVAAESLIRIRIGLNAGEPIAEEGDLFGTAVIAAARIASHATGGEILASDVVRQLVAGKGFLFSDRGPAALRGFDDPVRLYAVHWDSQSA